MREEVIFVKRKIITVIGFAILFTMFLYNKNDLSMRIDSSKHDQTERQISHTSAELCDQADKNNFSKGESTARRKYNELRANYIFEKFDMNPSEYSYVCNFDLMNYIEIEEYNYFRESMNIIEGTTAPSFYVGDGVIFGVCQDEKAVNHLYEFSATDEKTWELHDKKHFQDIGRYQDIFQSFQEFFASENP